MKLKHLSLALATFLVVIGVSSTWLVGYVTAEQIPELAWKCLPPPLYGKKLDIRKSEFLEGIVTEGETTYLIVNLRYKDAPLFEDQKEPQEYVGRFAIKLFRDECFNLNDPRTAADFNFSSRIPTIPEKPAKEIALQFWRRNLAWYGNNKEKLKADLLQPADSESTAAIYAEDQWALKQLGIDVPLIEPDVGPVTYEGLWQLRYGTGKKKPTPAPSGELFENERRQIQQLENTPN
jgi:hypothetical protein